MALYSFEEKYRRLQKELLIGSLALGGIFLLGTLWYLVIERWSIIESLYMTTITLSTASSVK